MQAMPPELLGSTVEQLAQGPRAHLLPDETVITHVSIIDPWWELQITHLESVIMVITVRS